MQLDGSTDVFFHKKTNVSNLWGFSVLTSGSVVCYLPDNFKREEEKKQISMLNPYDCFSKETMG